MANARSEYFHDLLDDVENLKDIIIKIPFTYSAFISPSGKGLKVIIKTDSELESHTDTFNALRDYYDEISGIVSDKSVKDVTRLCFVSYDPNLYLNESSETFRFSNSSFSISEVWDFTSKKEDFIERLK